MLSDEQKREAILIVSVGCDLETAARYVGCPPETLASAAASDPAFGADLRRAEAGAELSHMRGVQQAARDAKNWRASVWWLERNAPERYARRNPEAVSRRELAAFLQSLATGIAESVRDESDRLRVLERLQELTDQTPDLPEEATPDETSPGEDPQ